MLISRRPEASPASAGRRLRATRSGSFVIPQVRPTSPDGQAWSIILWLSSAQKLGAYGTRDRAFRGMVRHSGEKMKALRLGGKSTGIADEQKKVRAESRRFVDSLSVRFGELEKLARAPQLLELVIGNEPSAANNHGPKSR